VAGISRHLLSMGKSRCVLFTDLANPVSNSIYAKIGYTPVCDFDEYGFE
jgi:predicted GNAT family acetyltransferase